MEVFLGKETQQYSGPQYNFSAFIDISQLMNIDGMIFLNEYKRCKASDMWHKHRHNSVCELWISFLIRILAKPTLYLQVYCPRPENYSLLYKTYFMVLFLYNIYFYFDFEISNPISHVNSALWMLRWLKKHCNSQGTKIVVFFMWLSHIKFSS